MTVEQRYEKIEGLRSQERLISESIEREMEMLASDMAQEMGVRVGSRVRLDSDAIVVIHKLFVGYSNDYRFAQTYRKKISPEDYEDLTKRKFALHAQCYATTKKGEISRRESPEYNTHCLEHCEVLEW